MSSSLEAAIPPHLKLDRSTHTAAPPGFTPTTPSYSARFDPSVSVTPLIFVGIQYRRESTATRAALESLIRSIERAHGPVFWDRAEFVDGLGYTNLVLACYWRSRTSFRLWQLSLPDDWWHVGAEQSGPIGYFCEIYLPGVEDTETTFSHPVAEGYAKIADRFSGETDSHEYWGSARERIPRAQRDQLMPGGEPTAKGPGPMPIDTRGHFITVQPHDNLVLLRSGQDWSDTTSEERAFYIEQVKPLLEAGMVEISESGRLHGCYFNRYMMIRVPDGPPFQKTYSLSAWRSLTDLETWCRANTHLAIFAAGVKHYRQAGSEAKLRLYHEVIVVRASDQEFTYLNCHNETGMLNAIEPRSRP